MSSYTPIYQVPFLGLIISDITLGIMHVGLSCLYIAWSCTLTDLPAYLPTSQHIWQCILQTPFLRPTPKLSNSI